MIIGYRRAQKTDLDDLVELRIKLNYYDMKEDNITKVNNERQLRDTIKKVLEKELNKTIYFYIALDEKENKVVAGGAIIIQQLIPFSTIPNGKVGFITSVYTNEKYRHMGIQKNIMKMMIECARYHNCQRIELNATNPNAIKLYESYGFKKMDFKYRLELL